MNELTELADLRAGVTGRRPEDLARARETLNAGINGAGRGRPRRLRLAVPGPWPGFRPGLRIALTGVAAVAAAVAVAAALLSSASPGGPRSRHGGGTFLTVAYVLGQAATAAARAHQPVPRPGQYIYVSSIDTELTRSGGATVCAAAPAKKTAAGQGKKPPHQQDCHAMPMQAWLTTDTVQIWLSVSGYRAGLLHEVQLRQIRLPWGAKPPRVASPLAGWTPLPPACHVKPTIGTYTYLARLPTDPGALRAWLYAHPDGGQPLNDQVWTDIGDLLSEMLVPGKLAAALFRVAATIPGARVVPHATDAAGRPGIAVARPETNGPFAGELIFDPRTYRLLGVRAVLTRPVRGEGPSGTVIESAAKIHAAVASRLPRHPASGQGAVSNGGCSLGAGQSVPAGQPG
jgi:hypothetical protein